MGDLRLLKLACYFKNETKITTAIVDENYSRSLNALY